MIHFKQWFICFALVAMAFIEFSCGAFDSGDPEVYLVRDSEDTFHFQWNEPLVADQIILVRAAYTASTGKGLGTVSLSTENPTEQIFLPDKANTIEGIEYGDPEWRFDVSGGYSRDDWPILKEKLFSVFDNLEFTLKKHEEAGSILYHIEFVNQPVPSDFSDFDVDYLDYTVHVDYTVSYTLNDSFEDQLLLLKAGSLQSSRISLSRIFDPPRGSGICTVMILPAEERRNFTLPAEPYDPDNREYSREILTGYPFQPYDVGDPSELTFNY